LEVFFLKEKPKRYLPAEDKFLGYAFQALGDHYDSWEEFQMKYDLDSQAIIPMNISRHLVFLSITPLISPVLLGNW